VKRWVRRLLGGSAALAATAGLVGLSRAPWTEHPGEHAQLRLAWRLRSELVRACRRLTAAELARLPAHMRREEVCEGGLRPYRLEVWVDDRPVADDTIRAAGAHADRPLFVLREFELAPGRHEARIRFTPLWPAAAQTGDDEREREARGATPPLAFTAPLVLAPRQVVLITYDEERRALVRRRSDVSAPR
jgi:hypothetical protein